MLTATNSLRTLKTIILFITLTAFANAATIKGKVLDGKTNEALTGALVFNKDNVLINDVVGLDGSYTIRNIAPGKYTFVARFIGFTNLEKEVTISDANEVITLDFLMEAGAKELGQYTIVSEYEKGSDNFARSLEKNSDYEMNIVSAKTIQMLPDLTIGNVLQRVSGVTMEKTTTGEGRYAIIRGMDKRYNYTTVDGIKIPSPDTKNRYVPMDIFPAELVERLEVIKTLNASMEGDAIGGVMNLKLRDAPDKFICDANVSTGYSQYFFDQKFTTYNSGVINNQSPYQIHGASYLASPSDFPTSNIAYNNVNPAPNLLANFSIGDRYLKDKLGVIFSGSYQNTNSGTKSFFLTQSAQPNYVPANGPIFDDIETRFYSINQIRDAVHLKLDYDFNKNNKITFYTVYVHMDEYRERHIIDTLDNVTEGNVNIHDETKTSHQSIYNSTLHGEHTLLKNLTFDWSGAYADASQNIPDWNELQSTGSGGTQNILSSLSRKWVSSDDKDKSVFANLTYKQKLMGDNKLELKIGAMDRNKVKSETYDDYDYVFTAAQPVVPFNTIPESTISISDPTGTPQNANNYNITENIHAFYGEAKLNIGKKFEIMGGLRDEYTADSFFTQEPYTIEGKYGYLSYSDLLPSWSIKYAITDNQNLRAGYFASITRPNYFDLVPYSIAGEYFTETGNDSLKHTQADNYDLRYEWFPKPSEEILVGVFYKYLTDPIEYAIVRPPSKPSAVDLTPVNIANATNYGFEFVIAKYYRHWGISANYTYTKSQITTDKALYSINPTTGQEQTTYPNQTRPLQGQADNIANISLIYKHDKMGLDVRASLVYTGKLIAIVSPDYGLDYWQMPMARVDLSFEKKLSKKINLSVFGKVNNLLNTALILRIEQTNPYTNTSSPYYLPNQDDPNSIIVEKEQYGQSYLLGFRYKF